MSDESSQITPEFLALPPKRQKFVLEFLQDDNGKEAAIRAGFAPNSAHVQASRLLNDVNVQAAIQSLRAKTTKKYLEKYEVTAERVLAELARLAYSNMEDFTTVQDDGSAVVNLCDLSRDQMAALQEITVEEYVEGRGDSARDVKRVKIKLADKGLNLERLGRTLALFSDTVNVNVKHSYEQLPDEQLRQVIAQELEQLGVKQIPHLKVINGHAVVNG